MKIWDELLKTIQVLTAWPLIALYLALLFRQAITQQIPTLVERLVTIKFKGLEADFESLKQLAGAADPKLTRELTLKGIEAQSGKGQRVDEDGARGAAPTVSAHALLNPNLSAAALSPEQEKIVNALSGGSYDWRTRDRMLFVTGLTPEQLDPALAQLLQQDIVKPAFSKNHNVVFGLRERVDGK